MEKTGINTKEIKQQYQPIRYLFFGHGQDTPMRGTETHTWTIRTNV
jgi:hypothetical protein